MKLRPRLSPTLDRFLGGHFLGPFFVCLAAFTAAYLLGDIFDRFDDLMRYGGFGLLGLEYFALKLPLIISQLLPVAALAGVRLWVVSGGVGAVLAALAVALRRQLRYEEALEVLLRCTAGYGLDAALGWHVLYDLIVLLRLVRQDDFAEQLFPLLRQAVAASPDQVTGNAAVARLSGAGAPEDVRDPGGRRRLSVGPGHRHPAVAPRFVLRDPPRDLDLGQDRQTPTPRGGDGRGGERDSGREGEPPGAQGVPLTPGRSIAVDKVHVYGTPFFIEADLPIESARPATKFRRLMVAQDTGSAILGPARADLYWGAGDEAAGRSNALPPRVEAWRRRTGRRKLPPVPGVHAVPSGQPGPPG